MSHNSIVSTGRRYNPSESPHMQICELGALAILPNSVVQKNLNRPMRHHVAGTMLVCSTPHTRRQECPPVLSICMSWALSLSCLGTICNSMQTRYFVPPYQVALEACIQACYRGDSSHAGPMWMLTLSRGVTSHIG